MAIYKNLKELGDNTLKYQDIVILGDTFYKVVDNHLRCENENENNTKIFKQLNINDRQSFCTKLYGYSSGPGAWPTASRGDFRALTRVVKALFEILESKEDTSIEPKKLKIGDTVKIKSKAWYDRQKKDRDGEFRGDTVYFVKSMSNYCGDVFTITTIDSKGNAMYGGYHWEPSFLEEPTVYTPIPESDIPSTPNPIKYPKADSEFKFNINKPKKVYL